MDTDSIETYVARLEVAFNRLGRYLAAQASRHQAVAPGPVLSGSQRILLRTLVNEGPYQVSEVAALLGVTLSASTGLVDRLVKAGLATRERDQKDRRVVWVKVTPEGAAAVAAAEARQRAALGQLVRHLSEEDLSRLCRILDSLGDPRHEEAAITH